MSQIKVEECGIEGLYIITPTVHGDSRGYFMETYNEKDFQQVGLNMRFVQDNQSMSSKGVLRGLHYQKDYPQGKLGLGFNPKKIYFGRLCAWVSGFKLYGGIYLQSH